VISARAGQAKRSTAARSGGVKARMVSIIIVIEPGNQLLQQGVEFFAPQG
jgi:hypothetical protein